MYIVTLELEPSTGFHYTNICKDEIQLRDGFELISSRNFANHKKAISALISGRSECATHNYQIDPTYSPPTRRRGAPVGADRKG